MKIKRIAITGSIFLILFFGLVAYIIQNFGRDIIERKLSNALNRTFSISNMNYLFPFGVTIHELNIDSIASVKRLTFQLHPTSFFTNQIKVIYAHAYDVKMTHIKSKPMTVAKNPYPQENEVPTDRNSNFDKLKTNEAKEDNVTLYIWQIKIDEGLFNYIQKDENVDHSFHVSKVSGSMEDFHWPARNDEIMFNFQGVWKKEGSIFSQGTLLADGWINLFKKDMDGKVRIVDDNNRVGILANIAAIDNIAKVNGEFNVSEFTIGGKNKSNLMVGVLSSIGIEVGSKFEFETELDNFRLKSDLQYTGEVNLITDE